MTWTQLGNISIDFGKTQEKVKAMTRNAAKKAMTRNAAKKAMTRDAAKKATWEI